MAVAHVLECIAIARATGSHDISLWLADGTNYPGQDDLRARRRRLLAEDRLGGFHFNGRKYGDDDLMVGTTNPLELFLIYHELAVAEADGDPTVAATARSVAYMIDQSHNVEQKIPAMLLSVMNCQAAYAKALLVDRTALRSAQKAGDVVGAHRTLMDAFETDVRPLLAHVRTGMGAAADPPRAYKESGYQEQIECARVGGHPMSW